MKKNLIIFSLGVVAVIAITGLVIWLRSRPIDTMVTPMASTTTVVPTTSKQQELVQQEQAFIKANIDSDGDGLSDALEKTMGTDAFKVDTDDDGYKDGDEVTLYKTDPLKKNTSTEIQAIIDKMPPNWPYRGVPESVEIPVVTSTQPAVSGSIDNDQDGLTNDQELQLGTEPNKSDTDGDGLSDGDEVLKYGTNPLSKDTDGDGYTDAEEVKNGYNPLGPGKCIKPGCLK